MIGSTLQKNTLLYGDEARLMPCANSFYQLSDEDFQLGRGFFRAFSPHLGISCEQEMPGEMTR